MTNLEKIRGKVTIMEPERQERLADWITKWMLRLEREDAAKKTA